jgi:hypothetical protein
MVFGFGLEGELFEAVVLGQEHVDLVEHGHDFVETTLNLAQTLRDFADRSELLAVLGVLFLLVEKVLHDEFDDNVQL